MEHEVLTKFSFVIHQMLVNIYSNTSSPLSFPGENSQSTDNAIGYDFLSGGGDCKVTKISKTRVYSKALARICEPSWPFGSTEFSWHYYMC